MLMLIAQAGFPLSVGHIAIMVVVVAAIVALVYIALNQFGIAIPPWVVSAFWVLVVAFCIVFAIKLAMTMG